MRVRLANNLLATGVLAGGLAACATPQPAPPPLPPDPYGNLRHSAVCTAPTPVLPASGAAVAAMTIGADGGFCAFHFAQPGGVPFAAGLVTHVPAHGEPLIYNYNGGTEVGYTPNAGYIGPDRMTVELVPGAGKPRVLLTISITVTGLAAPAKS